EAGSPSEGEGGAPLEDGGGGMDASPVTEAGTGAEAGSPDAGADAGPVCMCDAAVPVCLPGTAQCVQGNASNPSACTGDKPVCDLATSTCVACTQDSQCPSAARAKCDLSTKSCVPCDAKAQCAHVSGLPVCSSGVCVQCSASDAMACSGTNKP